MGLRSQFASFAYWRAGAPCRKRNGGGELSGHHAESTWDFDARNRAESRWKAESFVFVQILSVNFAEVLLSRIIERDSARYGAIQTCDAGGQRATAALL